jgi:hypothetical protein
MTEVLRELETKESSIVIVIGAKRTGKTTLINKLCERSFPCRLLVDARKLNRSDIQKIISARHAERQRTVDKSPATAITTFITLLYPVYLDSAIRSMVDYVIVTKTSGIQETKALYSHYAPEYPYLEFLKICRQTTTMGGFLIIRQDTETSLTYINPILTSIEEFDKSWFYWRAMPTILFVGPRGVHKSTMVEKVLSCFNDTSIFRINNADGKCKEFIDKIIEYYRNHPRNDESETNTYTNTYTNTSILIDDEKLGREDAKELMESLRRVKNMKIMKILVDTNYIMKHSHYHCIDFNFVFLTKGLCQMEIKGVYDRFGPPCDTSSKFFEIYKFLTNKNLCLILNQQARIHEQRMLYCDPEQVIIDA